MSPSDLVTENDRLLSWVQEDKNGGDSSEVGLASSLYKACLRTLGILSKQYVTSKKPSRESKARIVESHARLCLFGDELLHEGALEHCLKGDHDLRDEVIGLLYCLGKTLLRGLEILYHVDDPVKTKEELVSGLAELVEIASTVVSQQNGPGDDVLSNSDCSESEESEIECETTSFTDDDDILGALDTYTMSLMDLRPLLEQSLRDIFKPSARGAGVLPPEFQVTESARSYVLQVHDKFREAKSALVERLGEANWQRYMRIKAMMAATANKEHPGGVAPENVPKSTFRPVSLFHDSGLGTSLPSRSQYSTSNASHTSFLTTETDTAKGRLRVPSTPMEVSEGVAFTCWICTQKLSGIRNRVDWKMHVFADLQPYVCTFLDCPDLLTTYPTRRLWAEHEFTTHRSHQQYECHDCSRVFSNENEFVDHISNGHDHLSKDLNYTQLLATISAAKKSVLNPLSDQVCPLCQKTSWTLQRDFVTHLGRHLEDIALSSLPREDDSESGSGSETETSSVPGFRDEKTIDSNNRFETVICKHCKRPVLKRIAKEHIVSCLKSKQDKARKKKEARDKTQLAKAKAEGADDDYDEDESIKAEAGVSPLEQPGRPSWYTDKKGRTYLARACSNYDVASVKAFYAKRPQDLNVADYALNTPLQIAALEGSVDIVKFLLDNKCDVNTRNSLQDTPLIDAVEAGNLEVVRLLLEYGANPQLVNQHGDEPYKLVRADNPNAEEMRKLIREAEFALETQARESENMNSSLSFPEAHDEEDYTIKCICAYADDDGHTVLCEKCDTWQHIQCYYQGQTVPDEHFCTDCHSRELDGKSATERQRRLRERLRDDEEALLGIKRQHSSESLDNGVAPFMARRKKDEVPRIIKMKCADPTCDKVFNRKCDLAKHEETHSHPFKCLEKTCKYHYEGLPTAKEMQRHINDKHNSNPQVYKCAYCSFESKHESNCKQHMEKKHGREYERVKGSAKVIRTPGQTPQTPMLQRQQQNLGMHSNMPNGGQQYSQEQMAHIQTQHHARMAQQAALHQQQQQLHQSQQGRNQVHSGGQAPAQSQAAYQAALMASQKSLMEQTVNQQGSPPQPQPTPQQHAAQLQHQASMQQQQQLAQNQKQSLQLPNGMSPQHQQHLQHQQQQRQQLQRAQMHNSLMATNPIYAQQFTQRSQQLYKQNMTQLMQQVGGDQSRISQQQVESLKMQVSQKAMRDVQEVMKRQQQARAHQQQMGVGGPVDGAPSPAMMQAQQQAQLQAQRQNEHNMLQYQQHLQQMQQQGHQGPMMPGVSGASAGSTRSTVIDQQQWSTYIPHLQQALRQGWGTPAEAVSNEPPSASPLPANDDDGLATELEAALEEVDDESDLIRSEKE